MQEINLNELLANNGEIKNLKEVQGIAKRAIAGLQVLRDRADLCLTEITPEDEPIGSSTPGQIADHGRVVSISGETGVTGLVHGSDRHVRFLADIPLYRTVGGRPSFDQFEGGNVPFELMFVVSAGNDSDAETAFRVRLGNEPFEGGYYPDEPAEWGASHTLPSPVEKLVKEVLLRLAQETMIEMVSAILVTHPESQWLRSFQDRYDSWNRSDWFDTDQQRKEIAS
jgi:hypothetical protein